jgi:cephalosporin hydroxylase
MITVDLTHIKTLKDFYSEIRSAHQKAHGDLYVAHHDKMVELATECVSYRELGVMQGATAAAVVLAGIRDIHLIDINMSRFKPYKHLFESHVDTFHVVAESSIKNNPLNDRPVDMLLIDSLHNASHVKDELRVHAPSVKKYILFHDTNSINAIRKVVDNFVKDNPQWKLIEHFSQNVGYSLIGKVNA